MPARVLAIPSLPETARPVLVAAALLADRLGGAQVDMLHVRHSGVEDFMPTEEVMTGERRREAEAAAAGRSAAIRTIFDAWVLKDGAASGARWRERTGRTGDIVAEEAVASGFVVLARPSRSGHGDDRQALRAALFDARAPVLLVPDALPASLGRHPALAWKPGAAAERAVTAAMPVLRTAGRVTVLCGDEAEGSEAAPDDLPERLARAGIPAGTHRFATGGRRIGEALLAEARALGVDLLVMGAWTHGRLTELVLGGATRDVLAAAEMPVLMRH